MKKEQHSPPQRDVVTSFETRKTKNDPHRRRRGRSCTTNVLPFLALVILNVTLPTMAWTTSGTPTTTMGRPSFQQQQQQRVQLWMSTPMDDDESLSASSSSSSSSAASSNEEWQSNQRNDPGGSNPNNWRSSNDDDDATRMMTTDWQTTLESKEDGSFWSQFELPPENDNPPSTGNNNNNNNDEEEMDDWVDDSEVWLNTLASISAEEVEFNMVEANRADKAREMADWGFDVETIKNTFGIAIDDSLEKEEVEGMKAFRDEAYLDDEDWKQVESHSKVEKDPDTGEPFRQQMVYVDEHTCIGCTNCAMIAQSTFFMNEEHGRARVFQQWGDDQETIQIAIETCPVDCIHYVPYKELVALEIDRRGQNINPKGRLVSQAENGNSLSHRVGGPNAFTAPQKISGNMGSRCNNCPSRGCRDCPMFGVGKNPEYERKEKERLEKRERRRLQEMREEQRKTADL